MLLLCAVHLWLASAGASNSTALEGWQFDGSSRSTWDIVWGCLATIIAATWTALHGDVPARNVPDVHIRFGKYLACLLALLAPELLTFAAIQGLKRAVSLEARCNAIQIRRDEATSEPPDTILHKSVRLTKESRDQMDVDVALHPPQTRWTTAHGFCINMGGLALQTEDGWIFTLEPDHVQGLIEAGIIRCSDFASRDIKDRAKADSFAKAFTVVQSTWSITNIIARAAYGLPISPIELSTVAYVACALFTYAFWWHKPKGMTTPIMLHLRYTRRNLPEAFTNIDRASPVIWVHKQAIPPKLKTLASLQHMYRAWRARVAADSGARNPSSSVNNFSPRAEAMMDAFAILVAILFCGVHVAAWNFVFPTPTENMAWRVFALIAASMACVVYIVGQAPPLATWLAKIGLLSSRSTEWAKADAPYTAAEGFLSFGAFGVYVIARLGIFALTFASLRALPVACYESIDWLASIPHL